MSVVIHEVSHGFAAEKLGDPTARMAGRLTLNPINHIDLFGSFILPVVLVMTHSPFLFGWAKPVPYNPYNLKNQKWGPAMVAAAGPLSNLFLALIFGLVIRFSNTLQITQAFLEISIMIVMTNIVLAVFNLIPVPPLDGSKVLFSVLPYHQARNLEMWGQQYGLILLVAVMFFAGAIIEPIFRFLYTLITGHLI
jgi:Zn-dependent protease